MQVYGSWLRVWSPTDMVFRRPSAQHAPVAPGEAQMALNTLRLTEELANDSNFRLDVMQQLHAPLAAALALPGPAFVSCWCGGAVKS